MSSIFLAQGAMSKIPTPIGAIGAGFLLFLNPIFWPFYAIMIAAFAFWFKYKSPMDLGKNKDGEATWLRSFTTAFLVTMGLTVLVGATIFPFFVSPPRYWWALGMFLIIINTMVVSYLSYRCVYLCKKE